MPYWRAEAVDKRQRFVRRYVAVVGSCGKSTTSMLICTMIGAQRTMRAGLLENVERNVLRTLRRVDGPVDYVVQEVSEFPVGTIGRLLTAGRPDCGVVTSAGLDHFTEFRTVEGVAAELSTLSRATPIICLNADDPNVLALAATAAGRVVTFGTNPVADVRAVSVVSHLPGRLRFDLVINGVTRPVQTRFAGTLMLTNILGALAALHAEGLDMDKAVATLEATEPALGRLSVHDSGHGHTIILDTVKAPLWSTRLLVEDLPNIAAGPRIFVLGELSDTGSGSSSQRYRQVLKAAARHCDLVIRLAQGSASVEKLAGQLGNARFATATTLVDVARLLQQEPPATVLIKGNALTSQHEDFFRALQASPSAPAQPGEIVSVDPE